jgi:hypothetical protein
MATIGLGQQRTQDDQELPIVTAGDDVRDLGRIVPPGEASYSATDVLRYLLAPAHDAKVTAGDAREIGG